MAGSGGGAGRAGSDGRGGTAGTSGGRGGAGGSAGLKSDAGEGGSEDAGAGAASAGEGGSAGSGSEPGGLGADCNGDEDCSEGRECYGDFGCAMVCEEETTQLTTAAEVLALAARGCEVLNGNLSILGQELTDVAGLESSALRVVTGYLSASNSSSLESLRGLGRLERIGGSLVVEANERLKTLEGLEGLDRLGSNSITDTIVLSTNPLLEDVGALANASRILVSVVATGNTALKSLAGIDALRATNSVLIANNPALTELGGLQKLEAVGNITVASNEALGTLQLPALETAETMSITGHAQLAALSLPALRTVSLNLTIAANPSLLTLGDTDAWVSVGAMIITDNASLPQCEVDALDARLIACGGSCALNDAEATCD